MANFTFRYASGMIYRVILNKLFKSGKSKIIAILIAALVYLLYTLFLNMQLRQKDLEELDRLRLYHSEMRAWAECFSKINVKEITATGEEVMLMTDVKACSEQN